jgi:hypothetical protein
VVIGSELSSDFYEDLSGSYLRVATVANSKFYSAKDFEKAPNSLFTLLSSSESRTLWAKFKQCKPEDEIPWYEFDSPGLIIYDADAELGRLTKKLALKIT